MTSSTEFGIPGTPNFSDATPSFNTPFPTRSLSSQCAMITAPSPAAFFIASRYTRISITLLPSSENATAPAFNMASISTSSFPSMPFVIEESCFTCTYACSARFKISCSTSTLSTTGFVFGIAQTVVTPPAAAAREPVMISSLYVSPGSRKCTCRSINPGITYLPFASITRCPFSWASL